MHSGAHSRSVPVDLNLLQRESLRYRAPRRPRSARWEKRGHQPVPEPLDDPAVARRGPPSRRRWPTSRNNWSVRRVAGLQRPGRESDQIGEQKGHKLSSPRPRPAASETRLPDLQSGHAELPREGALALGPEGGYAAGERPAPRSRPRSTGGRRTSHLPGSRRRRRRAAASNVGCVSRRLTAPRNRVTRSPPSRTAASSSLAAAVSIACARACSSEPIGTVEDKHGPLTPISGGRQAAMAGAGFEPAKAEPTDLQSVPFDRSGIPPEVRRI